MSGASVTAPKAPRIPERVVQRQIVTLLRSLGAAVWTLGTTRRRGDYQGTMQALGVPDLMACVPRRELHVGGAMGHSRWGEPTWIWLMVECKARGERLRPEQADFRDACQRAGVAHVTGGVDDVLAWLADHGIVRVDNVPHYRREQIERDRITAEREA